MAAPDGPFQGRINHLVAAVRKYAMSAYVGFWPQKKNSCQISNFYQIFVKERLHSSAVGGSAWAKSFAVRAPQCGSLGSDLHFERATQTSRHMMFTTASYGNLLPEKTNQASDPDQRRAQPRRQYWRVDGGNHVGAMRSIPSITLHWPPRSVFPALPGDTARYGGAFHSRGASVADAQRRAYA